MLINKQTARDIQNGQRLRGLQRQNKGIYVSDAISHMSSTEVLLLVSQGAQDILSSTLDEFDIDPNARRDEDLC